MASGTLTDAHHQSLGSGQLQLCRAFMMQLVPSLPPPPLVDSLDGPPELVVGMAQDAGNTLAVGVPCGSAL